MIRIILFSAVLLTVASCGNNTPAENSDAINKTDIHAGHQSSFDAENYIIQLNEGSVVEDTLKGSPMRIAMGDIGKAHLHIAYSAPGVKGRVIWGGLVAYNKVWVTGAHKATCIIFTEPALFNGVKVAEGAYALFTIPKMDGNWTVILNKNYDQHLADDYDEKEDILRTEIKPTEATPLTQRLTYSVVNDDPDNGALIIAWEKIKLSIPLKSI